MRIKTTRYFLLLFITCIPSLIKAQGHYNGGSFNPNDYFIPPASGWVFSLFYSYSNMNYYNNAGSKTDVIEISQNPPIAVTLGQKVKTKSVIPMLIYFGKKKVLNAQWGFLALPMINGPSANIALDFYTGQGLAGSQKINFTSFGLGDFYLQPIWLTWDKKNISTTFSYGAWLPVGKYKVNDAGNVGLGYWSHNFRVASRYKPKPQVSLLSAITLELNGKQKDTDFREATHITADIGGGYNFAKGGHEIGFFGFGTWQAGNDKGSKAVLDKDRIYGVGIYGAYWLKPGKFSALGRFTSNVGTKNRFGGQSFQLGLNYLVF
jgi:hypothetical protein